MPLILKTLAKGPSHGYAVAHFIEATTGDALLVEEGSLYPALYRLERRGWVEAEWGTSELGRRAKLYRLTDSGSVQQRVRDFGVRRALGATTADVLRLVVSNAVRVVVAGAVIGLELSALLGRLIVTMLFGVHPLDLTTFTVVTIVVAVTSALSIAGPAWRAAQIDPAVVLRSK